MNIQKEKALKYIKELDNSIKKKHPDFKRSYSYKPIEKIIKKTDAKYLLKYDKVRVKTFLFGTTKDYSIQTVDINFPQFESDIVDYLLLKSQQRLLRRISSRISKLNCYYRRPSELFARFIEGMYIDFGRVDSIAPFAVDRFILLLREGYYRELADFINKFFDIEPASDETEEDEQIISYSY